jgi:hypothetical protein
MLLFAAPVIVAINVRARSTCSASCRSSSLMMAIVGRDIRR